MPLFRQNSPRVGPMPWTGLGGLGQRFHNPFAYGAYRDVNSLVNGIVYNGTSVWSQHNYHLSPMTRNINVNRLIMGWSSRVPPNMRNNK